MFILLDPKMRKSDELTKRFESCLVERKHYFPVISGKWCEISSSAITEEEVREVLSRFLNCDVCRIGARHGQPLGYHFGMKIVLEKTEAILTEYITEWNNKKDIVHQVKAMSEILGYQYGIKHLHIPFLVDALSDEYFVFEPMPETNSTRIVNLIKVK